MGRTGLCASRAARLADAMSSLVDGFLCGFFGMLYLGLPYLVMGHEI